MRSISHFREQGQAPWAQVPPSQFSPFGGGVRLPPQRGAGVEVRGANPVKQYK